MKTKPKSRGWLAVCLAVGCVTSLPAVVLAQPAGAAKAAEAYQADLGPTPVPDGVMSPLTGTGVVKATLSGQTLNLEGQFAGVNSNATDAHLMRGTGIGIPGLVMADITVADGKVSGAVKLTKDQLAGLRAGQIYIQVNSAKSAAPAGHIFGWLLPAHETAADGEPQQGQWYLPQGLGLKTPAPARGRKS